MRVLLVASLVAVGLAPILIPVPAGAYPCFYIWRQNTSTGGCPGGSSSEIQYSYTQWGFDCRTGAQAGPPGCDLAISEYAPEAVACYPIDAPPPPAGPHFFNGCRAEKSEPSECKVGGATSDGRRDGSGQVGDPVDLTTGALSLDPVDVDLGSGLRFARHYASNASQLGPLGYKWSHSLDWRIVERTTVGTVGSFILVREPMRPNLPFFSTNGASYESTSADGGGALTVDQAGVVRYKSNAGIEADFDALDRVKEIRYPGELPIVVTHAANSTTFTRGPQSLVISTSGGRISSVIANGETWSYEYENNFLTSVEGPDPSTADSTDRVIWNYVPDSAGSHLIKRVDRITALATTTLGEWEYNGARVERAEEQTLEQTLEIEYSAPQAGIFRASVFDSSSPRQLLALYDSRSSATVDRGVVVAVTKDDPVDPVPPGGPGVPVPFVASTTEKSNSALTRTRTDKRGNLTLFDGYDDGGRPQIEVRGWVDGPSSPGELSPDDSHVWRRDSTWHPILRRPLTEEFDSLLEIGEKRKTIFDYDDRSIAEFDPAIPNESPTGLIHARIDRGYTFDSNGNIHHEEYETSYTYDGDGRLKTVSGPRPENHTEHDYDANGYRERTRRYFNGKPPISPGSPDSYLETVFSNFDSRGNPRTVTDPNGHQTTFTYDTLGRIKTVTLPFSGNSSEIEFFYDIDGNMTRVDFPADGAETEAYSLEFNYDSKNQLEYIKDSAGNAIVYEREKPGRVTREARFSGFVDTSNMGTLERESRFDYDLAGRLISARNPLPGSSASTTFNPDEHGNPGGGAGGMSDENNKNDVLLYDALDRLTQISRVRTGGTYVTEFEYDSQGNTKRLRDPAARDTHYQHDDFGRLVKVTSPNTGVTLFKYDPAGNVVEKTENFAGTRRITSYTYDGLDRLTSIILPNDPPWVFTYDECPAASSTCDAAFQSSRNLKGRFAEVTNGVVTTTRGYTPRGDLALERTTVGGATRDVAYAYDAPGNLRSVTIQDGTGTPFSYAYTYLGGRPGAMTISAGGIAHGIDNIRFAPFGGRVSANFPPSSSVVSTRAYNRRGQVSSVLVSAPSGTVIDRTFNYSITGGGVAPNDPGPNLDQIIDGRDASQSRYFHYDTLDRVAKSAQLSGTSLYQYVNDSNGNRTIEVSGGTTTGLSYVPGTDRIATVGFSFGFGTITTYYHHDGYGNRIWEALLSQYSGQPTHDYDDENRLIEYRHWSNLSLAAAQYSYDVFDRRVRKTTASATTHFIYDSSGHLLEERVASTGATRNYAWLEDEPVAVVDSGAPPIFSWIHTDYLGMPIAVTDTPTTGNAATIWRANYAPFGLAGVFTDPDDNLQHFTLNLRFPGQYFDGESNYHYNWHRYYDPSIGRYISADPIGQRGGINEFVYATNDPTNRIDPFGLADLLGPAANDGVDLRFKAGDIPPYVGPLETAWDAEREHFPGNPDPYGGSFRHCVAACTAREHFGPLGDGLVKAWDYCQEDSTDANSQLDMEGERAGLAIAKAGGNCVQGCLGRYPSRAGGLRR